MYYKSKAFCVNGKLWVDKFGISLALHYFCKHKYYR